MFASRVLPGAALVRAIRCRVSALIRLDLPTFDRPTSTISERPTTGNPDAPATLVTNSAEILKGRVGARWIWWARLVNPPGLPGLPALPDRLMSNGVVGDGAVDRPRLRLGGQTSRQRLGQRYLQDLVHRLDH